MLKFLETVASTLSRDTSDHVPCLISIKTHVPKARVFRFENFWMEHSHFDQVLQHAWAIPVLQEDAAKRIVAKLKNTRRIFKEWSKQLLGLAKTITNTKQVIAFLDTLEEARDLSLEEWNVRKIVQEHLQRLLHQQLIYWKQRGTIKWVKFGDECTEFFHATASVKHRKSVITALEDAHGNSITSHQGKANLLWESYKERLGTLEFTRMHFDLEDLLVPVIDLERLELPFTHEEINKVIKQMPTHKSPGPDGFNTDFMKRCWSLVAPDFYALCQAFYDGNLCLQSINSSYVTLVPKMDSPLTVADYRPISLLNTCIKLIKNFWLTGYRRLYCSSFTKINMASSKPNQYKTV